MANQCHICGVCLSFHPGGGVGNANLGALMEKQWPRNTFSLSQGCGGDVSYFQLSPDGR